MALAEFSTEVLRLLCAQNNLPISGSRDDLVERLGSTDPRTNIESDGRRTRSQDALAIAGSSNSKRARIEANSDNQEEPATENDEDTQRETDGEDDAENNGVDETILDGGGTPNIRNTNRNNNNTNQTTGQQLNPIHLASLISTIVEEKLMKIHPPTDNSQSQRTRTDLADPRVAAALLAQRHTNQDDPPVFPQQPSSIAAHVSPRIRQSIARGEFVEFDSLLPENSSISDNEFPGFSVSVEGQNFNIPLPSRRKKTQIDSIEKWISAFTVYCTIFLAKFPFRAVEMFAYLDIIRSAQRKFSGFAWLSYDIDFRRKAATTLSLNWGERDLQLYLLKFTGMAKTSCFTCGSGDHLSHGCPLSLPRPNMQRNICSNYNRGVACAQTPCPFQHRCKICNRDHPSYRHDDPSPKARSQSDKKSSHR